MIQRKKNKNQHQKSFYRIKPCKKYRFNRLEHHNRLVQVNFEITWNKSSEEMVSKIIGIRANIELY